MKNKNIFIYGLVDPRNNKVKYIGWTINTKNRYKKHLSPYRLKKNSHKNNWIKQLLSLGLSPVMKIIEMVSDDEKFDREKYWISFYGRENLTNSTDGGDGALGHRHSKKSKEKMSIVHTGHRHSQETKNKIAKANKGKIVSDSTREKLRKANKGMILSEESKKIITIKKQGVKRINNKYVGVRKKVHKWEARITKNKVDYFLGYFDTEERAALEYNKKAIELYGENAKVNIIESKL